MNIKARLNKLESRLTSPAGIDDVRLNRITVEVQTITIGNRQMTKGVLQQIIVQNICNPKRFGFLGVPLGFVNWTPANEIPVVIDDWDKYLHVLWLFDGYLRRCVISCGGIFDAYVDMIQRNTGKDMRALSDTYHNALVAQTVANWKRLEDLPQLFIVT